ncbi:MAG: thiamine pyrophosphate-dependent enzyme, partial [Selenomonas artemidis]
GYGGFPDVWLEDRIFQVVKPTQHDLLMEEVRPHLAAGGQAAFLIREGALTYPKQKYENLFPMRREDAVAEILNATGDAVIVATTGKTGRELFELREARGEGHASDFLTVGSMGHASAIALGIALHRPQRRVICIDGDGAALMHMGAMATIGAIAPENLVHILLNNEAHESVGGAPTVADSMNFLHIAEAVGYRRVRSADDPGSLRRALQDIQEHRKLTFLEVRIAIGSRSDLGRPTTTPAENKAALMQTLH